MLLRPGIRLQGCENQLVVGRLKLKEFLLDDLSFHFVEKFTLWRRR